MGKAFGNGNKKALVVLIRQGLLTSQISFDDALEVKDGEAIKAKRVINLQADEWLQLLKFLYAQVDGPPPQKNEVSGPDGGKIPIDIEISFGGEALIDSENTD